MFLLLFYGLFVCLCDLQQESLRGNDKGSVVHQLYVQPFDAYRSQRSTFQLHTAATRGEAIC